MNLIIVESPTKSKTIQRFLSPDYRVLSSYGHIRDLPEKEFGIDISRDFQPKYVITAKAKKIIPILFEESRKAGLVTLATDEDREGEAIAWHLAQALQLGKFQAPNPKSQTNPKSQIQNSKPYARIVFHEITKQAIEEALRNPRDIDLNLVDAQQARRILDRIVGYKLSPFLWKKVRRGLSAGRVQSVAVRLVVEREREIQSFIPQEYWSLTATFLKLKTAGTKSKTDKFEAILIKKNGKVIPKLGIKTKEEVDEILKDIKRAGYLVVSVSKKEAKRNPLPAFTTSTLTQEAWQRFRSPAKLTMQVAQQLYENGIITYHRTDSLNLSDSSLFAAKKFIEDNYGKDYWPGFFRRYQARGKAQEAHEAIRPTDAAKSPEKLKITGKIDEKQLRLYDLIWRRFIACQMAAASFDATNIEIDTQNTNVKYTFRATGQILKFAGFLKVYPLKFAEVELPALAENEELKLLKLLPSQHFTQPPARFSEATLIRALEENGIGRPSTYAPILSTIQERNYIEKDEHKRFGPTEIGTVVNDLIVAHFPEIVDIKFTAKMEEDLDKIAEGRRKWVPVIRNFYQPFEKNLQQKYQEVAKKNLAEETNRICPKCGASIVIRSGRFGKFYACSAFPKCKYTEPLKKIGLGINCPKCGRGEIMEKKTKKRKIFYGCSLWPKCDFALWDKPTGKLCPKCKSLLVETKNKQIRCSSPECSGDKQATRKIAKKQKS